MSTRVQDFYARATDVRPAMEPLFQRVADAAEARFNDPRMQAVVRDFLSGIEFPDRARVLEIGCGVGGVTRMLAQWPNVAHATGVDSSKIFIERAQNLAQDVENVSFEEGDGGRTRFDNETFDVVVLHTVICHALEPQKLVAEAFRVLRSGGLLAVCDADYATVANGSCDPMQACIDVLPVQNLGLVRRLPLMFQDSGFESLPVRSHGYVEAPEGGLMVAWVGRGADALVKLGRISNELSEALQAEAERRSASKSWFGHISFFSAVGRKP